jgi:peptide/nickel transport system substrate-binding protein
MNKEPWGLYIFRFIVGVGLLAFMCMLYWSSALLEEDMRQLKSQLSEIKSDLSNLRLSAPAIGNSLVNSDKTSISSRPHIDPSLPNLLQEDPFYTETLPKLLGKDFSYEGTLKSATIGKPDNLHPFSNWGEVIEWTSNCVASVAKQQFGKYETLCPYLAIKMEARKRDGSENFEYWVHLRDQVYWQPLRKEMFSEDIKLAPHFFQRHQVTAYDFKFYIDALLNPHVNEAGAVALRTYYNDIEEIEVLDKLTFIVRWKPQLVKDEDGKEVYKVKYTSKLWTGALKPLPSFVYQFFPDGKKIVDDDSDVTTYRTNLIWAQNFAEHWAKNIIVSCGPWIFTSLNDRQISFIRNKEFYLPLAALTEKMEVQFKLSTETIWQDFKSNALDTYTLRPEQLLEYETFKTSAQYQEQAEEGARIERLDYLARRYSYIGWNQAKVFFKSQKVRQALTLAIDRQRIIRQTLNGLGEETNGTFFPTSSSYDASIPVWPFDPSRAKQMLEEEGWYDSDGDGTIDKLIDGVRVPFRFSLTYFVKNSQTKAICEYVATALKEVGIVCNLNGVDIADLSAVFEDKSFDAISMAWGFSTPPEDPKQVWYSAGAKEDPPMRSVLLMQRRTKLLTNFSMSMTLKNV